MQHAITDHHLVWFACHAEAGAASQRMLATICVCSSALLNAGYKVSGSHACAGSIKTNAPNSFIWDMMRAWVQNGSLPVSRG